MDSALLIHAAPNFASRFREQMAALGAELDLLVASSARAAQSLWKDRTFALVVCELRLPVVGKTRMSALEGLQFLRLLHRRKSDLRSVVLVAEGEEVYASACLDAGVSRVLPEATAFEGLVESAMELLGQTRRSGGAQARVSLGALGERLSEWVQAGPEGDLAAQVGSLRPELRLDLMDFLAHKASLLGRLAGCGEYRGATMRGSGFEGAILPAQRLFLARQNGRPEIAAESLHSRLESK